MGLYDKKNTQLLRIRTSAYRKLRRIAAMSDEHMIDTFERVLAQEASRLGIELPDQGEHATNGLQADQPSAH